MSFIEGWGPECDKAFHAIKEYLACPLTLSQPIEGEELYLYLAVLAIVVSAALVRSDEDDKQNLVYFVHKMLIDVETRYTNFERIMLALRTTIKKLCPCFQAHTIIVLTSYFDQSILYKQDDLGQLLKWAFELSEIDIVYRPRFTIKGQVLIDFMVKMSNVRPRNVGEPLWILETDGSPKVAGRGASMVLQSPKGLSIAQAIKFTFAASNNEAKYKVVLLGLRLAKELSVMNLELRCDSLVPSQLRG